MPSVRKQFPTFNAFASASLDDIYGEKLEHALHHVSANHLESGVWINNTTDPSSPQFDWIAFPRVAQIAPIYGIQVHDFNADGKLDIYALQNSYSTQPETGWWRGGLSQLMLGNGDGNFHCVTPKDSGLCVANDAKALAIVDLNQDQQVELVVTQNNDSILTFEAAHTNPNLRQIQLSAQGSNKQAIGAKVEVSFEDGTKQLYTISPTAGYLTQSPASLYFTAKQGISKIKILWPSGALSSHDVGLDTQNIKLSEPTEH